MSATVQCGCCGKAMEPFFEQPGVPVNSCILVDDRPSALSFPRGDIRLGFCRSCGFVSNMAFRQELTEYSGRYEETQAYSSTFNRFQHALVTDLVRRLEIRNKDVAEIGCGKGEFLALLCREGGNRGVGYDPGYDRGRGILDGVQAAVIVDFFSAKYATHDRDFVACKMTLEHIPTPAPFVRAVLGVLRPSAESTAFFQVPEAMRILEHCAFEDVYYEHCSYFTPGSLARLFRAQGFDVNQIDVTYGGQYLTVEASPAAGRRRDAPLAEEESAVRVAEMAETYAARFRGKVVHWRSIVQDRCRNGAVVLWGSGSKAVSFLRALDMPEAIEHVIDINPHRQGHYMPGTGQRISAPAELQRIRPRTVIAMNAMYRDEIARDLARLEVASELMTL